MKEVNGVWVLEEPEIRRKVIELLDMRNMYRMNLWMTSGILAGVVDAQLVERVLQEEMPRRAHQVRHYWTGEPCTCRGHPN